MADIQLRFDHDMLVMSTPFEVTLGRCGFEPADRDYAILCETEVVEESFKFEKMAKTPVFLLPTQTMTNARLMHSRFEGHGADMARLCLEAASGFSPQHVLACVAPTGLPLDESSKTSLKQSRDQYQDAVRTLATLELDGVYFQGFESGYDLLCALMGARAVYDGVVMASYRIDAEGELPTHSHGLADAARLACEYGANVVGIVSGLPLARLVPIVKELRAAVDVPLLVELEVGEANKRQLYPTDENPYPTPDALLDAALGLRALGVQFVRAAGNATPAYTGVLAAIMADLDVVLPGEGR